MINKIEHAIYRAKYRYGKNLPLKKPVDISLELSSACNQKCGYCYHADPKNLPFTTGFMHAEMAIKIIDQAADLGVHSLKFNYRGESTLHPQYHFITHHAKEKAHGMTFIDRLANSNFKIPKFKRDKVFAGLSNLTKVKISFDSLDRKVFEYQRAGASYDLALENIDLFYNDERRLESGTKMVIQAVRTNLNKDEDFSRFKDRWPDAEISIREVVEGRVDQDVSEYTHKDRDDSQRQSCKQAHVRLIFSKDGLALPCCPDIKEQLALGNIGTMSLKDIFNGYRAKQLRKDLKSGAAFRLDPCKSCSSFESYKGYRAPWGS